MRSKFRRAPRFACGAQCKSRARTRAYPLTALGNMMVSLRKTDSQGVEAAERPQLMPVSSLSLFSPDPRVSLSFPVPVLSCPGFPNPTTSRRLNQWSSSQGRSSCEKSTWVSCLKAASKFESARTKSSMNSFTNHLGRVYEVSIMKRGL